MNLIAVVLGLLWLLSSAYWSRYKFRALARGSLLDERLGGIHLMVVFSLGVVAAAMPSATDWPGSSALAFAASGLFLASVPLYFVKKKDPSLMGYRKVGRHTDTEGIDRPTSRWPYTVAYMFGYFVLFAYFISMGAHARGPLYSAQGTLSVLLA